MWQHVVLVFGATSSVWGYNRFGDALVGIGRLTLATLCFHYVDDYGGVEEARTAESASNSFGDLNAKLGAAMGPSKAQPPSTQHVIQGVLVRIEDNHAVVCATTDRKAKLTFQVANILTDDCLTPQVAGVLAGKFGFVASSLYGQVARLVLRAIYMRQKAAAMRKDLQALTPALRASLKFLVEVLTWAPPRRLDSPPNAMSASRTPTLSSRWTASSTALPIPQCPTGHRSHLSPSRSFPNGWGVVVRCPATAVTWYACGVVPTRILARFTLRRQYIFLLETLAQCLASWLFYYELGQRYLSFVDNTASQRALTNG